MYLVFLLVACVALIIVLSTRLQVHPFLALLFACLFFGLFSGMPLALIASSINDGFGGTLGRIGMVIILGVIIGEFLEKSGGALAMAEKLVQILGKSRVPAVMSLLGYVVAIPVFADSGFIILSPLNRSLTKRAGLSFITTSIALTLGLVTTHTMVPPTPGPIAATGILNANMGLVLLIGIPVAFGAMLAGLFYSVRFASQPYIDPEPALHEEDFSKVLKEAPGAFKAALPIMVPILLIVTKSFIEFSGGDLGKSSAGIVLRFLGEPVMALTVGFFLVLLLPKKLMRVELSTTGWVGKALKDASIILLITGAGGAFGKILQNSGIAGLLSEMLSNWPLGLWLPFIIAAAIKSAQGSSTVAMITTASIMTPLMVQLGFDADIDRAVVVIAIGAGSIVVSHVNDSMFWILTQVTRMDISTALKRYTPGSLFVGVSAFLLLNIIYFFLH
jgi:GntP family gluconate:H+ symporter